jgi:N6-L-threonylcarbamoyladenine synthase
LLILAVETSCDDTAAAVLRDDRDLLSSVVSSQLTHREYGGVVPEIASRQHLKTTLPTMEAALERASVQPAQLDAIAATAGPGLLGSVLVGLSAAKAYAFGLGKPFIGVHHIEGHILANWLVEDMRFPNVVLVISGGHTQLIYMQAIGQYTEIGSTRDDAVGEAFDKIGKMLGIPYPAGPVFEKLALQGDAKAVAFTRARLKNAPFDFSFSGLKTAARLKLQEDGLVPETQLAPLAGAVGAARTGLHSTDRTPEELAALPQQAYDILASAQDAITDMLSEKCAAAVRDKNVQHLYLAGGVAANSRIRSGIQEALGDNATLHAPPPRLCTDNAAMIACVAHFKHKAGIATNYDVNAFARGALVSWA